jgi:chaperonin GroEL
MLSNVLLKQASRRSAATAVVMAGRRGFAKEIKFGVEGRAAMLKGVDVLADAVQVRTQKCM